MSRFCSVDNRKIEDHPKLFGHRYCELILVEDKKDKNGNIITVEAEEEFNIQRTKGNNKRWIHESRVDAVVTEEAVEDEEE